jgi:hypothetical protein
MKAWAGNVQNGQIILNLCDGKVATFKFVEHGRVKDIKEAGGGISGHLDTKTPVD